MKNENETELIDKKINNIPVTRDAFAEYIIQGRNNLLSMTDEIMDEIRSLTGKPKIDAWSKCVKLFTEMNPTSVVSSNSGISDIERLLMEEAEIVEEEIENETDEL